MATITNRLRQAYIDKSCGCSATRFVKFKALTPDTIEEMAQTRYGVQRALFENMVEAPMVGVKPKGLMDILLGNMTKAAMIGGKVTEQPVPGYGEMRPLPYSYRRRENQIANEYFQITPDSGVESPNAGTTVGGVVYPASSWQITVRSKPDGGWIDAKDGQPIASYFKPKESMFIQRHDNTGGAGNESQVFTMHKIIASTDNGDGTATVTVSANRTDTEWAGLTAGEKAVWQPAFGVIMTGTNNIDDYENYCETQPVPNANTLVVDYHQTSRYVQCYNKEYLEALDAILNGDVNSYQDVFKVQSVVEQNRRQFELFQKKWYNSIMYGQPLGSAQSPELYTSTSIDDDYLVYSPEDDCPYGFKANAKGIRTLLSDEGMVIDLGGGYLDLDQLLEVAYIVKRNREIESSQTVDRIDIVTDKDTSDLIARVLIPYLKSAYGTTYERNWSEGKVADEYGATSFTYNVYSIPNQGLELAVIVDNYFTDRLQYFPSGGTYDQRNHAGEIWMVDLSDINIGIVETNSKQISYKDDDFGKYNNAWKCTMKLNREDRDFRSTTWTVQLGNAKKHAIFTGFSLAACPRITQVSCSDIPNS